MENAVSAPHKRSQNICEQVMISIRRIIQSIDLHSRYLQKRTGLTGPQLLVLYELSVVDRLPPGRLAKAISLSQATVTGIVERLEKKELVTRVRGTVDRRQVMVQLTAEGRSLLEDAPPLMQVSFIDAFQRLENWEQSMILSSLQRLVQMMDARDPVKDGPPDAAAQPPEEPAVRTPCQLRRGITEAL